MLWWRKNLRGKQSIHSRRFRDGAALRVQHSDPIRGMLACAAALQLFGAGIGALCYFLIADKKQQHSDVSGEPIAVVSNH